MMAACCDRSVRLLGAAGVALCSLAMASVTQGQDYPKGKFVSSGDVGAPAIAGSTEFDPQQQTYKLSGAGVNMWAAADQFHFAWLKMTGNFVLTARAEWLTPGVDPHRKLGKPLQAAFESLMAFLDVVSRLCQLGANDLLQVLAENQLRVASLLLAIR